MIIGTALIVLCWTVFKTLGMHLALSIILTVVGAFLILFGLLFVVYFFNLDMKFMAFLESKFVKIYDKRKRNRNI